MKMNATKKDLEDEVIKDMNRIRDIILDMAKNRNEEHERVRKYMNKIARLSYSGENEERQVISILLHCLTFKLNCKTITVRMRYQNNNTDQYNLNRKNSGSILQNSYEDLKAARVNEK